MPVDGEKSQNHLQTDIPDLLNSPILITDELAMHIRNMPEESVEKERFVAFLRPGPESSQLVPVIVARDPESPIHTVTLLGGSAEKWRRGLPLSPTPILREHAEPNPPGIGPSVETPGIKAGRIVGGTPASTGPAPRIGPEGWNSLPVRCSLSPAPNAPSGTALSLNVVPGKASEGMWTLNTIPNTPSEEALTLTILPETEGGEFPFVSMESPLSSVGSTLPGPPFIKLPAPSVSLENLRNFSHGALPGRLAFSFGEMQADGSYRFHGTVEVTPSRETSFAVPVEGTLSQSQLAAFAQKTGRADGTPSPERMPEGSPVEGNPFISTDLRSDLSSISVAWDDPGNPLAENRNPIPYSPLPSSQSAVPTPHSPSTSHQSPVTANYGSFPLSGLPGSGYKMMLPMTISSPRAISSNEDAWRLLSEGHSEKISVLLSITPASGTPQTFPAVLQPDPPTSASSFVPVQILSGDLQHMLGISSEVFAGQIFLSREGKSPNALRNLSGAIALPMDQIHETDASLVLPVGENGALKMDWIGNRPLSDPLPAEDAPEMQKTHIVPDRTAGFSFTYVPDRAAPEKSDQSTEPLSIAPMPRLRTEENPTTAPEQNAPASTRKPDEGAHDPFQIAHAPSQGPAPSEPVTSLPHESGLLPSSELSTSAPDREGDFTPAPEGTSNVRNWNLVAQIAKGASLVLGNGRSVAHIRLEPEDLGVVRMKVVTEGTMLSVRMSVEKPEIKHMLESNLGQLREALTSENVRVEKIEVFVGGGDFSEGSPNREDPRTMWNGGRGATPSRQADEKSSENAPKARTYARTGSEGRRVDYLG